LSAQLALVAPLAPRLYTCSFVVHGEPIPCGRPRSAIGSRGDGSAFVRVYADPKSDKYEKLIGAIALGARPRGWRSDWGMYALSVRVYRSERRGDGDNFAKAVADGCLKVLWDNDGRVTSWRISMLDELERPRIEVLARMVGNMDAEQDRKARTRMLGERRRKGA